MRAPLVEKINLNIVEVNSVLGSLLVGDHRKLKASTHMARPILLENKKEKKSNDQRINIQAFQSVSSWLSNCH
jgi:hypothetical protein